MKTAGVTYAQYAREGFAQLVVVGVLTLAVVAGALRWARTGTDARLLRALLASLRALTLVVLDAVPALTRLPEPLREQALGRHRRRLARGGDGFAGANLARARARDALADAR